MIETIYPYIDFIWFPVAMLVMHRRQKLWAACFFILGFITLRLMVEFMETIGFPRGIFGILGEPLLLRGLIVYSVFYVLYILLAFLSPGGFTAVFIGASFTIFFAATITAAIVMIL